jgi:hypothetical protein
MFLEKDRWGDGIDGDVYTLHVKGLAIKDL